MPFKDWGCFCVQYFMYGCFVMQWQTTSSQLIQLVYLCVRGHCKALSHLNGVKIIASFNNKTFPGYLKVQLVAQWVSAGLRSVINQRPTHVQVIARPGEFLFLFSCSSVSST